MKALRFYQLFSYIRIAIIFVSTFMLLYFGDQFDSGYAIMPNVFWVWSFILYGGLTWYAFAEVIYYKNIMKYGKEYQATIISLFSPAFPGRFTNATYVWFPKVMFFHKGKWKKLKTLGYYSQLIDDFKIGDTVTIIVYDEQPRRAIIYSEISKRKFTRGLVYENMVCLTVLLLLNLYIAFVINSKLAISIPS